MMKTYKEILVAIVKLKLDGKMTPSTIIAECDERVIEFYNIWLQGEKAKYQYNPQDHLKLGKPPEQDRINKLMDLIRRLGSYE